MPADESQQSAVAAVLRAPEAAAPDTLRFLLLTLLPDAQPSLQPAGAAAPPASAGALSSLPAFAALLEASVTVRGGDPLAALRRDLFYYASFCEQPRVASLLAEDALAAVEAQVGQGLSRGFTACCCLVEARVVQPVAGLYPCRTTTLVV